MEYTGVVGMMLMDKIVEMNEQISNRVDITHDRAQEALELCNNLDKRLEEKVKVGVLEECIHHLEAECQGL